jgi:hypothetical protein
MVLVLLRGVPIAAGVDKIRPANRVPRSVSKNPVKTPISDNRAAHWMGEKSTALTERQVPHAMESKRVRFVCIIQFVDQGLCCIPIVQTVILLMNQVIRDVREDGVGPQQITSTGGLSPNFTQVELYRRTPTHTPVTDVAMYSHTISELGEQ